MGTLDSIGGRKFLGFIALIAAGIAVEVYAKNGLSATMATFLGALYATFTAANAAVTIKSGELTPTTEQPPAATGVSDELAQNMAGTLSQIGTALNSLQSGQARGEQAVQVLQQSVGTLQKAVGSILVDSRRE